MYEGLRPCPHRRVDESGHILCGWIKGGDNQVSVNLCRACPVPQINCEHLRAALQKKASSPITVRYATGRVEVWNDEAPAIEFQQAACAAKTMPIHSPRDCSGCPLRVPHFIPQSAIQVARQNRPLASETTQTVSEAASPQAAVAPSAAPARAQRAAEDAATYQVREAAAAPKSREHRAVAQAEATTEAHPEAAAAREMVQRAKEIAARKQEERRAQLAPAQESKPAEPAARGETRSKIILLQQWLADQVGRKNRPQPPAAPPPDEYGVQDIVYAPIAPTYQEEPGLERCVGWTD